MAKKKEKKEKKEEKKTVYSDYPIKTLFRIAILGGLISFLLFYINNLGDLFSAFFRGFLIFAGLAFFGGLVMIVFFYIVSGVRKREMDALVEEQSQSHINMHVPPPQTHPQTPPPSS